MLYLIVEVHDPSYKEDIYLALQSIGVARATSIDGQNISSALTDEFTFFTGFFQSDKIERGHVLFILAQVKTREQIREFLSNLREADVQVDKEDIITVTAVPAAITFSSELGYSEGEVDGEQ